MTDLTYDQILEKARTLSPADQAKLIAALADGLRDQLDTSEASGDEFPSLASNLYQIAQDLEKNPPRPGWPGQI